MIYIITLSLCLFFSLLFLIKLRHDNINNAYNIMRLGNENRFLYSMLEHYISQYKNELKQRKNYHEKSEH